MRTKLYAFSTGLLFEEMISKYKQLTIDFQELSKKELIL